jgi:hypothetical protein
MLSRLMKEQRLFLWAMPVRYWKNWTVEILEIR